MTNKLFDLKENVTMKKYLFALLLGSLLVLALVTVSRPTTARTAVLLPPQMPAPAATASTPRSTAATPC